MKADLHLHSYFSDGKLSPAQLVDWVLERGVEAVSLTDHDTVDGTKEMRAECLKRGLKFVSGIEFSTIGTCEIHILGYNIDQLNPEFRQELENVKQKRIDRNLELLEKLHSLGIPLELDASAKGVGRMNFARAMVEQGFCQSTSQAFDRYLGNGAAAYTPAERLRPLQAVSLIKKYGGVAVLAHPRKYLQEGWLNLLVEGLIPYGLKGIEVYHSSHNETDVAELKKIAKRYKLIETGGSDYHGEPLYRIPDAELDNAAVRALHLT